MTVNSLLCLDSGEITMRDGVPFCRSRFRIGHGVVTFVEVDDAVVGVFPGAGGKTDKVAVRIRFIIKECTFPNNKRVLVPSFQD